MKKAYKGRPGATMGGKGNFIQGKKKRKEKRGFIKEVQRSKWATEVKSEWV